MKKASQSKNAKHQRDFRTRHLMEGKRELRGVYLTANEYLEVKEYISAYLIKSRG